MGRRFHSIAVSRYVFILPGLDVYKRQANHIGNDLVEAYAGKGHFRHKLTVPQDGHVIHDVLQLLQTVGDVHDAPALIPQLADDAKQLLLSLIHI